MNVIEQLVFKLVYLEFAVSHFSHYSPGIFGTSQVLMWVLTVWPKLVCPCVGVHRRTSLISSSLLLQQCSACLARLTFVGWEVSDRTTVLLSSSRLGFIHAPY